MTKQRRDIYQEVTNKIIQAIEENNELPWHRPWSAGCSGTPLRINGEPYRGINHLLLSMEQIGMGYNSDHWFTFKGAQEKGGSVKKGEKGTMVIFYKPIKIEDKETGDKKEIPMLKHYFVWNACQCEGLDDYIKLPEKQISEEERIDNAESFFSNVPAKLKHEGGRAFYRPATDEVFMPEFEYFEKAERYYTVLAHELIHWTAPRVEREITGMFGSTDYAKEELVAELGAVMVCSSLGLQVELRDDHAAYVQSWLKVLKNDKKAIFKASSLAAKAADYLFAKQPKEQAEAA